MGVARAQFFFQALEFGLLPRFPKIIEPFMAFRGRPRFKPTPTLRRKVADLMSTGVPQPDIARAIGCSVPTLRRYFHKEVEQGNDAALAELLEAMWRAAMRGNASALIWWAKRMDRARGDAAKNAP
jgi:hypothetical protein